jgi:hypothetical protein
MTRKPDPTTNPPKAEPKGKPEDSATATDGERYVSPYLRRPLRRLDEVEHRPDAGDRTEKARPGKNRHEGDGNDE